MVLEPSEHQTNNGFTIKQERIRRSIQEELLTDVNKFFTNIFKKREENKVYQFLGDLKDKPVVLMKKLTEELKQKKRKQTRTFLIRN